MKYTVALALLVALVSVPVSASAHEVQQFEIGGQHYQFVVGSLNEPVAVDDKTGVELMVSLVGHEDMAANDHHGTAGAIEGLEESLQVELIAGDAKKVLSLSPVYNTPGSYKAPFYPTVATTLSYRFFGTIHETPVDLTFTCSTKGHGEAEEDTTEVEISDGVTRVSKTGAFSCPSPKEPMGFPEPSASVQTLSGANGTAAAGVAVSVLALLLAGYAVARKK